MNKCLLFDWNTFFSKLPSEFVCLNFARIFLRKGLFLNPVFPAFNSLDLQLASSKFGTYKSKKVPNLSNQAEIILESPELEVANDEMEPTFEIVDLAEPHVDSMETMLESADFELPDDDFLQNMIESEDFEVPFHDFIESVFDDLPNDDDLPLPESFVNNELVETCNIERHLGEKETKAVYQTLF